MTNDEKLEKLSVMLGSEDYDLEVLSVYLNQAKEKILNKRYPFGTDLTEVPSSYEYLQLELAIALFNQQGAEGQSSHSENGVSRTWRKESEILASIPSMVGLPL